MNSYDDMQRFRDKAQIKDIDFRDMSSQMLQSDAVAWPLMKQLLRNPAEDNSLSGTQLTGVAQPVPVSASLFNEPAAAAPHLPRLTPKTAVPDAAPSLLSAVAASLPPVVATKPVAPVQPSLPQPVSAPAEPVAEVTLLHKEQWQTPAAPLAVRPAAFAAAAGEAAENGRFRALFSSRSQPDNTPSLSKTMLLKPLLEKIALCR